MANDRLKSFFIILFLSIAGMSAWLFEILFRKGWYGLNWLDGNMYSPYLAAMLAAFAFATPFLLKKETPKKKLMASLLIFYIINLCCYELGKNVCYLLYCRFCFFSLAEHLIIFAVGFFIFVLIGILYWLVTHKFIRKNLKSNILLILTLSLLTVPLSMLTINVCRGFGYGDDWVDAVKMGYPIFWMILALGLSAMVIDRQKNITK